MTSNIAKIILPDGRSAELDYQLLPWGLMFWTLGLYIKIWGYFTYDPGVYIYCWAANLPLHIYGWRGRNIIT